MCKESIFLRKKQNTQKQQKMFWCIFNYVRLKKAFQAALHAGLVLLCTEIEDFMAVYISSK